MAKVAELIKLFEALSKSEKTRKDAEKINVQGVAAKLKKELQELVKKTKDIED